jgi:PIN domain nuclease of toxin-antitoxin system
MKFLLDTCTFLWLISDATEVPVRVRDLFASPENDIYLSTVSTWEIALKHSLGRLPLPGPPGKFIPKQREDHGVQSLPLDEESTFQLLRLPNLHNDPFDRLLICQAIVHGLTLLTPDELVSQYLVRVVW